MSYLKRQQVDGDKPKGEGRVYVMKFTLVDGTIVHKVGMTHSDRCTDRLMEVLRSWFTNFRYVPFSEIRLEKKTGVPHLLEKHLHSLLEGLRYMPDKKVDGGTEMFTDVDEVALIKYIREFDYNELMKVTKMDVDDYKYIQSQVRPVDVDITVEDIPF